MKKTISILITISMGVFGFSYLNKNLLMLWNSNKVEVGADQSLSEEKVKIEYGVGVNSINRINDLALFRNREKYIVVYDGKPKEKIGNEYGENDFLITYGNEYYLSFKQFKFNRRHQHTYQFRFKKSQNNLIVDVKITGKDGMNFNRKMIKIADAEKYVSNTPIDSAETEYNMIELIH